MATDGNIKDDCPVTLQEDWRCCPLCGRKTAALFLEGVRFNVDAEAPKNLPLKVRLQGRVPLYGRLEFEPDSIVKSDSAGFLLDEARPSVNVLLTVPATSKMTLGTFTFARETDAATGTRRPPGTRTAFWSASSTFCA